MQFLDLLNSFGHLNEAIANYNLALDQGRENGSNVEVCQSLFNCLDEIQVEWEYQKKREFRDGKAFSEMILDVLEKPQLIETFLNSKQLQKLSELRPPMLEHRILRQENYQSDQRVLQDLFIDASEQHLILKQLVKKFRKGKVEPVDVLAQTNLVLYIIRSILVHQEKITSGLDLPKNEIDRLVSTAIIPLQVLLIDLLFNRAKNKFVSYGTLAPGEKNHLKISPLPGTWEKCSINGFIEKDDRELLYFTWILNGRIIEANLFISESLPKYWDYLDRFEGSRYKRRLIPVQKFDGKITVANIYLKNMDP